MLHTLGVQEETIGSILDRVGATRTLEAVEVSPVLRGQRPKQLKAAPCAAEARNFQATTTILKLRR